MSAIPTPYTLGWRRLVEGATDSHNDAIDEWDDPIGWPVHSYAPGANELQSTTNRDLSMVQWTVYAPVGPAPRERDKVIVNGAEFLVKGRPDDWSHGPWPHPAAGITVLLEDTEG